MIEAHGVGTASGTMQACSSGIPSGTGTSVPTVASAYSAQPPS
jgi:hypothetical protein